jgi:hypothetical protein
MPRRDLKREDPEVLKAIKEALRHPQVLTAQDEADLMEMRSRARIIRPARRVVMIWRRRKFVFRIEGRAGADMNEHPDARKYKEAERDYLSRLAKMAGPPIALGVKARQRKAVENEAKVLRAYEAFADRGSGAAAVVARVTGFTPQYVRRVIKKRT